MFLHFNDPWEVGIVLLEIILLIGDYLGCHPIGTSRSHPILCYFIFYIRVNLPSIIQLKGKNISYICMFLKSDENF